MTQPKNPAIGVLYAIVLLDISGIGITLPILPRLLSEVAHTSELGWRFGAFLGLYALMQFVFSPILGTWSDRMGRRPVLLFSLAGATVDYLMMAAAPWLALLFVGRAIAGITGASQAVAAAYLTDVTPEPLRARRFGQLNAFQGLGFIAGPLLGGALGEYWVRAPFIAAALLNGITFLVTLWVLREPPRERHVETHSALINPLEPFRWALSVPSLLAPLSLFVVFALIGQVGGTIWIIYGADRYAWTPFWVGTSLACFGLLHAFAQAFIAGPLAERWGARGAILTGVVTDVIASVLIAFAAKGWMPFVLMPLFCLGAIGLPALQSLLASQVDTQSQGRLQGVLASLMSLTSIVAPVAISTVYFATRKTFPGLVWIAAAALYFLTIPMLLRLPRRQNVTPFSA
jgi:DHA1 family tetracycline resistance protein-like MFS transporter